MNLRVTTKRVPRHTALDLLVNVLVDTFAEIYDHEDGDDRPEGTWESPSELTPPQK